MKLGNRNVTLRELSQTPRREKTAIWGAAMSLGARALPLAGRALSFAAKNPVAAEALIGAGTAAYSAASNRGGNNYAPNGAPQVRLVDPSQQFVNNTNAFGMRSSAPITRNYNEVLNRQRQALLMSKGASVKRASGLADLLTNFIPYQDPAEMNAVQVNSPTNPAQAAIRGERSALGYDRSRHGLMTNQMMTSAQTQQAQQQNSSAAEAMWRQNRQASRDAHSQRIDSWFAEGRKGPSPRYMSAERMLGLNNLLGPSKTAVAGIKAGFVTDTALAATDAGMDYVARPLYNIGTEIRRQGQGAYNWLNQYNPLANQEDMAMRNAQYAQDAQNKLQQLEMQRNYMKQRLGSQWTERNAAGINREIARLRADASHYKRQDRGLSQAAMSSYGTQIDPVKKMQMLDRRDEMIGFGSNSHLASGTNSMPLSNLSGSPGSRPPGTPGAPQSQGQFAGMSPRQHADQVRAGL